MPVHRENATPVRALALTDMVRNRIGVGALLMAAALLPSVAGTEVPAAAEAGRVSFAVVGDYGSPGPAEASVAALVDSLAPDFVVTTGDNVYDATSYEDAVGRYYGDYVDSSPNGFFPAPGNHDHTDPPGGISAYLDYFTLPGTGIATTATSGNERYYDFIQGPVHVFVLDSESVLLFDAEASAQGVWLEAGLAASTAPWQVVVLHHPPFSSGLVRGSTPSLQWPFSAWGADLVLSGHEHIYERLAVDGIPYVISGVGGRSLYGLASPLPESRARHNAGYGAVLVDACASGMTIEFHAVDAGLVDSETVGTRCSPMPAIDGVVLVEPDGRWHVRRPGQPDYTFFYGDPGDVALLGDWDGDGVRTPGRYRPQTGLAYLTNELPPDGGEGAGDPALTFHFGIPGDQVLVGDWDGDGLDTLGVHRNGSLFLADDAGTGAADLVFWFGTSTDVAFGGDPDGDGRDGVFLYRPSTGAFYYTDSPPGGFGVVAPTDGSLFFGVPGDRPVIGDWDGDGVDTVGVFRPGDATVYVRDVNTTGPAETAYRFGEAGWVPAR